MQILLTLIWLRSYPTMQQLSTYFGIPVSNVHRIIHKNLPILHVYLVKRYIKWPSDNDWQNIVGSFPAFPNCVAVIDGTPHRQSKGDKSIQRIFWRKDRHCAFTNWMVIITANGLICYSKPGFVGHLNDATCYRYIVN